MPPSKRVCKPLLVALLFAAWLQDGVRRVPPRSWAAPGRRALLSTLAGTALSQPVAAEVQKTRSGIEFEVVTPGSTKTGPREGPPGPKSKLWVKFEGRVGSFDGQVFDSSTLRALRRAAKVVVDPQKGLRREEVKDMIRDWVELTPSGKREFSQTGLSPGLGMLLQDMKVGERRRAMIPASLGYSDGGRPFSADDDAEVKEVSGDADLYYDVTLLNIVRP